MQGTYVVHGRIPVVRTRAHAPNEVEHRSWRKREILPGDLLTVRTCFINFTQKSLHVWGVMIDACTDEICAINDQVCVSLDTIARKAAPWPAEIFEKGKSLIRPRPEI